jgi:hypothetical protein
MQDTARRLEISLIKKILRGLSLFLLWFILALLMLWAAAALYIDCRVSALRIPITALFVATIAAILWKVHGLWKPALILATFCFVLIWWLSLKPSNRGDWQPDVARTAEINIAGDLVSIHNFRNCNYRTENDYSNCWSDITANLSQLRGIDFFLTNWGIPYISHPIISFDFGDNQHVAFSVEARYRQGQKYSAILGFFRQYDLIFVTAAESDVIRLRTNFRKDEEVYLYRTTITPEVARGVFLTYAKYLDRLRNHPEWYNALTRNCTTTLDRQIAENIPNPKPWNYRLIVNGSLDELLYSRGRLVTGGLPFPALKQQAHINSVARTVTDPADYSAAIRRGRVGF